MKVKEKLSSSLVLVLSAFFGKLVSCIDSLPAFMLIIYWPELATTNWEVNAPTVLRHSSTYYYCQSYTEVVPAQHNTRHKANVRQTDERWKK
jgi:hypothetical protein